MFLIYFYVIKLFVHINLSTGNFRAYVNLGQVYNFSVYVEFSASTDSAWFEHSRFKALCNFWVCTEFGYSQDLVQIYTCIKLGRK